MRYVTIRLFVTVILLGCIVSCKNTERVEDLQQNVQGFWIIPGDPVVNIVIEKDSVYYPDYAPMTKYPYVAIGDKLIVNNEEGVDTLICKMRGRDTLILKYNSDGVPAVLVRNN